MPTLKTKAPKRDQITFYNSFIDHPADKLNPLGYTSARDEAVKTYGNEFDTVFSQKKEKFKQALKSGQLSMDDVASLPSTNKAQWKKKTRIYDLGKGSYDMNPEGLTVSSNRVEGVDVTKSANPKKVMFLLVGPSAKTGPGTGAASREEVASHESTHLLEPSNREVIRRLGSASSGLRKDPSETEPVYKGKDSHFFNGLRQVNYDRYEANTRLTDAVRNFYRTKGRPVNSESDVHEAIDALPEDDAFQSGIKEGLRRIKNVGLIGQLLVKTDKKANPYA